MSKAGERMLEGAREALAIAKGDQPAASITVKGHKYVPVGWQPIDTAPRDGTKVILDLGESVPDTPLIATGSFISEMAAMDLGEDLSSSGGWIVWTSDSDWYVEPFANAFGWFPMPSRPTA